MKKTYEHALLWFGAGLSIAEILTGMSLAPLGLGKGLAAIVIGHLIGCLLLFLAGVIGGSKQKSAMESVRSSFGSKGSLLFSILNIIQLAGWTAIMIYDGALAAQGVFPLSNAIYCLIIGGLILVWIGIGLQNLGRLNTLAITLLLILTVVLSVVILQSPAPVFVQEEMLSFGAGIELSIAMPLSWLPLVSDYTKEADSPIKASAVSALCYGLISIWMYAIGLGAAIFTGQYAIDQIIVKAGLGLIGLLIIVFSTVTTTFLDAYSAGVSANAVSAKLDVRKSALVIGLLGMVCAIFFPITDITDFLYLIGSVFAPMIAIQIVDFFLLKTDASQQAFSWKNLVLWLIGFIVYRLFMQIDSPLGSTIPAMAITMVLCLAASKVGAFNARSTKNPSASNPADEQAVLSSDSR